MTLKTPLSRARGLGSAKEGVGHFILQRATAIANVPLTVWFVASLIYFCGADYEAAHAYLANPVVTVLAALFLVSVLFHMRLGLQVVIEDYIAKEGTRIALLLLMNFAVAVLAVACLYSVLKIGLGP
ncbi:MAG: succinate dehydrogenase, hydrophobic membrane anchor protein [Alphaproteobacteria bacterium]|nr:succinate dehydrogenase, hydrophobic membrane anchor protein [Alphaproteobacteria bacterium]